MREIYVLVPVEKSKLHAVAKIATLLLAVFFFLLTCLQPIWFTVGFVFALLWYLLTFRSNKEYEYSYFDGEIRFAKIMNKSRRKRLGIYQMGDVLMIAPVGDRSINRYENDSMIRVKDYSSRNKEHTVYEAVVQREGDIRLIKFEPDDEFLDAVEVKYKQKVVRKSER